MPRGSTIGVKRKGVPAEKHEDPAARLSLRMHHLRKGERTVEGYSFKKARYSYWPTITLPDELIKTGQFKGVNISIEASDTFVFDSAQELLDAQAGRTDPDHDGVFTYSRSFNPTVKYLGDFIASIEGTESAYCTGSGMSAITALMIHLCQPGDHVVGASTLYGGTTYLLTHFLPEKCGVTCDFVDISDLEAVEQALKPNTKVLYFETIANPALIVADIQALSKIAHDKGVKVVVDNTFSTLILNPMKFGADVVVLSATKYISGGGDIMSGVICGSQELIENITALQGSTLLMTGPVLPAKDAFELVGRIPHSPLRVKKQCNRALKLSQRIKTILKKNDKVIYPGLEDHPEHELLKGMLNKGYGYGGTFCVDLNTAGRAKQLLDNLKENQFGFISVSLGYYENLISAPGAHFNDKYESPIIHMVRDDNPRTKLSPGYIRICVGYLGTLHQKWEQFKNAYEALDPQPIN